MYKISGLTILAALTITSALHAEQQQNPQNLVADIQPNLYDRQQMQQRQMYNQSGQYYYSQGPSGSYFYNQAPGNQPYYYNQPQPNQPYNQPGVAQGQQPTGGAYYYSQNPFGGGGQYYYGPNPGLRPQQQRGEQSWSSYISPD